MKKSNAAFKKNEIYTLKITDLTDLGFGVGRIDGMTVFVSDTVPGDEAEAKIIKVNSSYLVARVERFIKRSPDRVDNRCEEYACKSCAYKCIPYQKELAIKRENVRRAFSAPELKEIEIGEIIGSPSETRYRNKAQYPISVKDGEYAVGFFAPKSHRVTPVNDCPLTPRVFAEITDELKLYFKENNLSVYSEESGEGLLRHIYLRRGEVSEEILLTLVTNGEHIPNADDLVKRITRRFPAVVGILLNVNCEFTNIILSDKFITLWGRDHIFDTLSGVELKITAPAFYQVNHDCAELLYAKAKELAAPDKEDLILDLYCGAGSIGLSMAKEAREIIGIEIVDSAVECAKLNAKKNGITNASFYTGDAADTKKLLENAERIRGEKIKPDTVILDPPRAGSDEALLRHIASLSPRKIVYVSCNPKTLARDVIILQNLGYSAGIVTPVDMFPGTGHVESVVRLSRKQAILTLKWHFFRRFKRFLSKKMCLKSKTPRNHVGTNDDFERSSKLQFTPVWYNISYKNGNLQTRIT